MLALSHVNTYREEASRNVDEFEAALNRALSEKLSRLTHDLNNGLGSISGYCELMLERTVDAECAKRLRSILDVVQQLGKTINGN